MSDNQENDAIVLDLGTGYVKCGFAGEDNPRSVFKNMIARPRADAVGILSGNQNDTKKLFVGEEAAKASAIASIEYTIHDGIISSWEAFHAIVEHAIETELRCPPEDFNVLLTEAPSNAIANRHKMYEIMFEDFKVKGAQCQVQAVLSLYASGRTTGMVVDSGDGVTHTVPVIKGFGTRSAVCAVKNAGRNVSKRVLECLNKYHARDYINEPNGIEIAREVKEHCCRVALNYDEELAELKSDKSKAVEYEFPDGSVEQLLETTIEPAEILYNPRNYGMQVKTLPEMLNFTIDATDVTARRDLFQNTVLSGGTTCLAGFAERIEKEYKAIVPERSVADVKVCVPEDRKFAVFAGGSILCGLASFADNWITLEEYNEKGPDALDAKTLF